MEQVEATTAAGEEVKPIRFSDGPWKIQKELLSANVCPKWGYLMLPKEDVQACILPLMDEEKVKQLERPGTSKASLKVRVVDEDKGAVYNNMKFTRRSSRSKCYILHGAWNKICKDRDLCVKDRVGLYWDPHKQELHFSVRERAAPMNL